MHMQIQPESGKSVTDISRGIAGEATAAPQKVEGQEPIPQESPSVENSVSNLQKSLDLMKETNFQVEYNQDIDRVIVKYRNTVGEVVRQVPSAEFVEFEKEFVKTIGLLFDKKV